MKKFVIAALLSAFVAAPAVAAGMYASVKLGNVRYGYSNVTNDNQTGFGLLGGYSFNEDFAIEAEHNSLGGFNFTDSAWKGSSIGLSGVGFFPLNQQFSLFGKLGIARSTLKGIAKPGYAIPGNTTINNIGLTFGLGGQYNVGKEFGIRAGVDNFPVGNSAFGTSRAGMTYVGGVIKF